MAEGTRKKLPKYVMDEYQTLFKVKRSGDSIKLSHLDSRASITIEAEDFGIVLTSAGFHAVPEPIQNMLDRCPGQEQKIMHSAVACYKQSLLTNEKKQLEKELAQ